MSGKLENESRPRNRANRWYRAYVGTCSDPKMGEIAIMAECSRAVAVAVWHAILESAADVNDGGRFTATPRNVAATLQEPIATADRVISAMKELRMIADGVVVSWGRRQFESDNSTERSKRHRESRKKSNANKRLRGNGNATLQSVAATPKQQNATPPDTESDTDTELRSDLPANAVRSDSRKAKKPKIANTEIVDRAIAIWNSACAKNRKWLPVATRTAQLEKWILVRIANLGDRDLEAGIQKFALAIEAARREPWYSGKADGSNGLTIEMLAIPRKSGIDHVRRLLDFAASKRISIPAQDLARGGNVGDSGDTATSDQNMPPATNVEPANAIQNVAPDADNHVPGLEERRRAEAESKCGDDDDFLSAWN